MTQGRSSDWASFAAAPSRPGGQWHVLQHQPYSVGHVADFHRIPDSPAIAGTLPFAGFTVVQTAKALI